MKQLLTDANFPRTADGRVYHVGVRTGEIANRIIVVGPLSRAEKLAKMFDKQKFRLDSDRGFSTITGLYSGVPITIAAIGMGYPNCDFFVREARECLEGDMIIIRLGSCGALMDLPVGSIVVPRSSVAVTRNYDFDFTAPSSADDDTAYHISKPVDADQRLHEMLSNAIDNHRPEAALGAVLDQVSSASADSFYSSQGRQTTFSDHNRGLISRLLQIGNIATLEMETFHVFHLASVWRPPRQTVDALTERESEILPSTDLPATVSIQNGTSDKSTLAVTVREIARIRAASVHMVYAHRSSKDFITPEQVDFTEQWVGTAILDCLAETGIEDYLLHPTEGSVWGLE